MNRINTHNALTLTRRLRRLRRTPAMRALVRETRLSPDMFVLPLFVCEGEGVRREVSSMPGVFNLSVDEAVKEAAAANADGVKGVILYCAAASAVTGPMHATSVLRRRSTAGSAPSMRTKLRTADPLVKVTTSSRRSRSMR